MQRIGLVAGSLGIDLKTQLQEGAPLPAMRKATDELDPDLVVGALDARELTPKGLREDSAVVRLLRDLPCTVVLSRVVNCGIPLSHRRILAPVESSLAHGPSSSELVELVSGMARFYSAALAVFSCVEISRKMTYDYEVVSGLKARRLTQLKPIVEGFMNKGVRPSVRVNACVLPDKEILDLVSRERYDLVIARAPRKLTLSSLRGPGVIERVLMGTPSNVLIWKPGGGR